MTLDDAEKEMSVIDRWRARYAGQDSTLSATMKAGGGQMDPIQSFLDPVIMYRSVRDFAHRPNYFGTFVKGGGSVGWRPPIWMELKDVAIDGSKLTPEALRDPNLWDRKYRKEMHIAHLIAEGKKQKRAEEMNDIWGLAMSMRRWAGLEGAVPVTPAAVEPAAQIALTREQKREKAQDQPSVSWSRFVNAVESGKPLARTSTEQYRSRIDFYGVDQFLDSPVSLAWLSIKAGAMFGMCQGFLRTLKIVTVDAQYLKASGLGLVAVMNVSIIAAAMKWAGNLCGASLAFCVGDQAVSTMKYAVLDPRDARGRTVANYTVGMSCAFACSGVLPWWVLNDVRLATRYAISGAFVGSFVGALTGMTLERMIAANLARLDASPRELRRFEALMAREKYRYLKETDYSKSALPHMF